MSPNSSEIFLLPPVRSLYFPMQRRSFMGWQQEKKERNVGESRVGRSASGIGSGKCVVSPGGRVWWVGLLAEKDSWGRCLSLGDI